MKVILVRHGHYDEDCNLSVKGENQFISLAANLSPHLKGKKVKLFSSTAPRARQSAAILEISFEISVNEEEKLWSDNMHDYDFDWLSKLIKNEDHKDYDVLVFVSHLEYVQDFPEYLDFPGNSSEYAQGVILDLSEHKNILISCN